MNALEPPETLSPSDAAAYREAALRATVARQALRVLELGIFLRYGMKDGDEFDDATGVIRRAPANGPTSAGQTVADVLRDPALMARSRHINRCGPSHAGCHPGEDCWSAADSGITPDLHALHEAITKQVDTVGGAAVRAAKREAEARAAGLAKVQQAIGMSQQAAEETIKAMEARGLQPGEFIERDGVRLSGPTRPAPISAIFSGPTPIGQLARPGGAIGVGGHGDGAGVRGGCGDPRGSLATGGDQGS